VPTTSNKLYSVQVAGTNAGTWGAGGAGYDLNTGVINIIDSNMAGVYSASLSSSNVTLSQADLQNCLYRFTGVLLASVVVSPAGGAVMAGFFYFENYTTGSFTVTLTTGAGSVVLPQSRAGVVFVDGTNGPRILGIVGKTNADPIPVGTVMPFYQASVPTGWTAVALDDYAFKIVSNGNGGVTSGSVNYSTLFATTTTGSHTLTTNEIPSHQHVLPINGYATGSAGVTGRTGVWSSAGDVTYQPSTTTNTNAAGGGAGHTHDLDMRVKTAAFVLGTKN
jgi:hypothetical protein